MSIVVDLFALIGVLFTIASAFVLWDDWRWRRGLRRAVEDERKRGTL